MEYVQIMPDNLKNNINVVIPLAGRGSRFQKEGYSKPKPFINVFGSQTMLEVAIESLAIHGHYYFIVRKDHREIYDIDRYVSYYDNCKNYTIIETDVITEGPADSVLLAREYIDNDDVLIVANCDQWINWDPNIFLETMLNYDGSILTYTDNDPKSSYVEEKNGEIIRTAEKEVISNIATVGIYAFKKGSDYIKYTDQMINKNIRVNDEFYVSLVYNEMIQDNKKITWYDVTNKVNLIGTPKDLKEFQCLS